MVATYKSKTAETRTGAMVNWGWSTGASGYDDEDRLVSWSRDDNNLSQSWTLTKEGDWSQFVENTTTENRTHGPAHELTAIGSTALSYDPKGNLTVDNTKNHKYTWDFDNRMSAADTDGDNVDDVTLKYDALGRRVAKTSGSATVVYVSMTQPIQYSPFAGQVVAEYASGAAPTSPTEKYVYASYIDEPVLKDGTGGTVYYHRNSQYSVAALTSTTGAVVERYGYEPYGELTILAADGSTVRASSSYANTYTYTGRRWDADLSLYYFRARYYDPKLGRFVGRSAKSDSMLYSYPFNASSTSATVDGEGSPLDETLGSVISDLQSTLLKLLEFPCVRFYLGDRRRHLVTIVKKTGKCPFDNRIKDGIRDTIHGFLKRLPLFKGIPSGCPLPCQECKYTGVRRWNPRIPIPFPLSREFWWKITGKVAYGHERPEGAGWIGSCKIVFKVELRLVIVIRYGRCVRKRA